MSFDPTAVLPDELVERIRSRAAHHDLTNTFPEDDLADLVDAGYLRAFAPLSLGGLGLSLADVSLLQQRLATAAPATALAINMHLVWTGVAALLRERGFAEWEQVLSDAAGGEIFAFGISEAGNDLVLFDSATDALPQPDGAYLFTGTKIFTSLSPVWTRLGVHGLDSSSQDSPRLVFAFLDRTEIDEGRITIRDDWDTLGMRATQSRTTELRSAHARSDRVLRRIDRDDTADPLLFAIFAVFEVLLASVHTGVARRALEVAVETARTRRSRKSGTTYDQDPAIRWRIADMSIAYDALPSQIARLAIDVAERFDHGGRWFSLLAGLKHRATTTAKRVVDEALLVAGGASYFSGNELSRLSRDVTAGLFHPSDPESAHSTAATAWLGPVRP